MSDVVIPQKSHFNIDEVALITGVKKYVLRYWVTEFQEIEPIESSSGQKLYTHRDIEVILKVKELLLEQNRSIDEVKKILRTSENSTEMEDTLVGEELVEDVEVVEEKVESQAEPPTSELVINLDEAREKLQATIDLADQLKKRYNWI